MRRVKRVDGVATGCGRRRPRAETGSSHSSHSSHFRVFHTFPHFSTLSHTLHTSSHFFTLFRTSSHFFTLLHAFSHFFALFKRYALFTLFTLLRAFSHFLAFLDTCPNVLSHFLNPGGIPGPPKRVSRVRDMKIRGEVCEVRKV